MVKAASLAYAIFISLVIGILCYSMMLVFSLSLGITDHFDTRKKLLIHNKSGMEYLSWMYDEGIPVPDQVHLFPEQKDIVTSFHISSWGVFSKCTIESVSKKSSIRQDVLLAQTRNPKAPAIYLRDNDEPLKISGSTRIYGTVYISEKGIKKTNISGNANQMRPRHEGAVLASDKILPKVVPLSLEYPDDYQLRVLEDIREHSFINPFTEKTVVVDVQGILEDIRFKGNIVLRSMDTLRIHATTYLEDVIIDAPKVEFLSGFEGTVQVFASEEIVLHANSHLNYPSVLVIDASHKEDDPVERAIRCEGNSSVSGAILLYGKGLIAENYNHVVIEEDASVQGDIFCDGKVFLHGKVAGSVYTSSLGHKTFATEYDNLLLNAKVLPDELPEKFFQLGLLERFESTNVAFIKKL